MWLWLVSDEEEDDGVAEEIDPLSDEFSPDDNLPPLRRILNYYKSDSTDNRYNDWVWLGGVVIQEGRGVL